MQNEVEKYYNLNDPSKKGPRGFVFAYDENGELLFTQENMIVLTGRDALATYGFDNDTGSKITYAVLTTEKEPTTPTTSKEIISENDNEIAYTVINRETNDTFIAKLEDLDINSKGEIVDKKTITDNEPTKIEIEGVNYSSKFAIKSFFKLSNSEEKPYALCKIFFTDYPCYRVSNPPESKTISGNNFFGNTVTSKFSCIRLYMGEISDTSTTETTEEESTPFSNATLFSRVVFPEYTKTIRNFMVFNYYIYF